MVDGSDAQRVERIVWCISAWRSRSVAGTEDSVCGLRGVAAGGDRGRHPARASRVLEGDLGRGAGVTGAAEGSCAADAAGICRWICWDSAGREVDGGFESAEPKTWGDGVHDAAGGMG